MKTSQVTVTTTATLLVAADPHDIGNASVTASTGFKIDNGDKVTLPLGAYEALYAITSTGSDTVYVYSEVN
jgi:hypothetical protein